MVSQTALNDFETVVQEPSGSIDIFYSSRLVDLTWLVRSTDNAQTWTMPKLVRVSAPGTFAVNHPVALPDGTLLLVAEDSDLMAVVGRPAASNLVTTRSKDSGATWTSARTMGGGVSPVLASGPAGPLWLVFQISAGGPVVARHSNDQGVTWSKPAAVTGLPPGSPSVVSVAVDGRGRVGVFADVRSGAQAALWGSFSDDGGSSWGSQRLHRPWADGSRFVGDYQTAVGLPNGFGIVYAEPGAGSAATMLFTRVRFRQ